MMEPIGDLPLIPQGFAATATKRLKFMLVSQIYALRRDGVFLHILARVKMKYFRLNMWGIIIKKLF
jgi:hypothetical protein